MWPTAGTATADDAVTSRMADGLVSQRTHRDVFFLVPLLLLEHVLVVLISGWAELSLQFDVDLGGEDPTKRLDLRVREWRTPEGNLALGGGRTVRAPSLPFRLGG